ncbi:hypothetical protein QUF64_11440 [Anaerolineales bacterium HSG6]|nr:hypothetical protein [Anaerolineales bacterium HSG6]
MAIKNMVNTGKHFLKRKLLSTETPVNTVRVIQEINTLEYRIIEPGHEWISSRFQEIGLVSTSYRAESIEVTDHTLDNHTVTIKGKIYYQANLDHFKGNNKLLAKLVMFNDKVWSKKLLDLGQLIFKQILAEYTAEQLRSRQTKHGIATLSTKELQDAVKGIGITVARVAELQVYRNRELQQKHEEFYLAEQIAKKEQLNRTVKNQLVLDFAAGYLALAGDNEAIKQELAKQLPFVLPYNTVPPILQSIYPYPNIASPAPSIPPKVVDIAPQNGIHQQQPMSQNGQNGHNGFKSSVQQNEHNGYHQFEDSNTIIDG